MAVVDEMIRQAERAKPTDELGTSGLNQFYGLVSEAYRKELRWPAAYSTLSQMQRRNPTIASVVNVVKLLARTASWEVEPASDGGPDQLAAEFLQQCLDDMSLGIRDATDDLLSAIPFGWSWSEIVYKRRKGPDADPASKYDDNRIGWRKFAPRRQASFYKWEFDDSGGVQGLWQLDPSDATTHYVPIEKSLHFVAQRDMGNPEGLSILEPAYEPWFFIQNLQIIDGIGFERAFNGLPKFTYGTPDNPYTPTVQDKADVAAMGKGLRVDEKAYVALPGQIGFELLTTTNTNADSILNTIKYHAITILQVVLADFIALGTTSTGGSYALGQDKSELFLMAIDGWLDKLAHPDDLGILNRYAVPRLFNYNDFPGITDYPRIKHTSVQKPNLPALSSYLSALSNFIHPDAILEADLRAKANLPEADETSQTQNPLNPNAQPTAQTVGTTPETGTQEGDVPTDGNGDMQAGGLAHPPARGQRYFQLGRWQEEFRGAMAEFREAMK